MNDWRKGKYIFFLQLKAFLLTAFSAKVKSFFVLHLKTMSTCQSTYMETKNNLLLSLLGCCKHSKYSFAILHKILVLPLNKSIQHSKHYDYISQAYTDKPLHFTLLSFSFPSLFRTMI